MSATRAFTSMYAEISDLADAALRTEGGVDVYFRIDTRPSPEACKRAAEGFRKLFLAMRAQDRNRSITARRERAALGGADPKLTFARSDYDKLHCYPEPLEDGSWRVCLVKATDYMASLVVVDRATGETIDMYPDNPNSAGKGAYTPPAPLSAFDPTNVSLDDLDAWTKEGNE